jgi:hypothetical protein
MNAAFRNIQRYGTKGDFVLRYEIGGTFDSATMKKTAGATFNSDLLAFADGYKRELSSQEFVLYVAVDHDFGGAIPVDSKIIYDGKSFDITKSDVTYIRNQPVCAVLTCNG